MTAMTDRPLQERLDSVRAAGERAQTRSPEAAAELLAQRARDLARPAAEHEDNSEDVVTMIVVQIGDDHLAIPLSSIVAIARAGSVAALPRAVSPVHGVTAWRGRPLTVLSLGAGRPAITADTRLVVLGSGSRAALALIVDVVHDLARTTRSKLSPAADGPRRRYAMGMTSEGLLVINAETLLHPETLSA